MTAQDRVERDVFSAVASKRVSGAIVSQIRELIAGRILEPGDRLPPERDLAERFGVSRVSVRDALRVLEVLGLVEIRVGAAGGAFVTAPTTRVVGEGVQNLVMMSAATPEHVAETRLILELGIVTLAVERATDDDVTRMREHCDSSAVALHEGRYGPGHSEAFHVMLAEATHNPALALLAESFGSGLSMVVLRSREDEAARHARSLDEHRTLVQTLADRDKTAARRAIAEHLTHGLEPERRAELLDAFPQLRSERPAR